MITYVFDFKVFEILLEICTYTCTCTCMHPQLCKTVTFGRSGPPNCSKKNEKKMF